MKNIHDSAQVLLYQAADGITRYLTQEVRSLLAN